MAIQKFEYIVDTQWSGFWGGYGAEKLMSAEINRRAKDGWRLQQVQAEKFLWFGISIVPPFIVNFRIKLSYFFEREVEVKEETA